MSTETKPAGRQLTDEELQELVASTDSGGRDPANRNVALFIAIVAFAWSVFQIWIADLQFNWAQYVPFLKVIGSDMTRPMHLTFALFLAFLAYPAFKKAPRHYIPIYDWIFAFLAAGSAFYLFWFSTEVSATAREGLPSQTQIIVGVIGIVLLLEAARRSLGPALTIVGSIFLLYSYLGQAFWIPDLIAHEGRTFDAIVNTQWLSTEGVFGIPLGVSTSFVFLFVLFGALLDKAGAGNYFIKLAFAGLGHFRGGPAKAAVLGSAFTGFISGSSISNVVTTGTFTMPLMKRVGFSSEKAGAIEVSSSVNGQIMPPVMGAAAFLMVEFVGISYLEVLKHAIIPALISYIALFYIVHLEALKSGMKPLGKGSPLPVFFLRFAVGFAIAALGFTAIVFGVKYLREVAPGIAGFVTLSALVGVYLYSIYVASKLPDLELDDPHSKEIKLPVMKEVFPTGIHYILPILVLIWFLMIERQSPSKSAYYAVMILIFIVITQRPLKAIFRAQGQMVEEFKAGIKDFVDGMIVGARSMIGIGVATAAAGIIVATVTRTPIGTELAGLVELLSMGNLFIMLCLVGLFSLILGMGLPTTANYIVVSSLMAGVVVSLGASEGLIVPLIAAHLFVFYFGLMADVTPPVGLASFAAAAVSGGDPIKTGVQAFAYSMRTLALPFLFIYNPALILYGVDSLPYAIFIFIVATIAMLLFAAATQGYFVVRSKIYESAALLLIAFTLFAPNFWLDRIQPEFDVSPGAEFQQKLESAEAGEELRILVGGLNFDTGEPQTTTVMLRVDETPSQSRLAATGFEVALQENQLVISEEPFFGTPYQEALASFDFYADQPVEIIEVLSPADRMSQYVFFIPAFLLLAGVVMLQRRRKIDEDASEKDLTTA